ncbi:hypothetical protein COBT_000566 [Conglomerata obtusa]
MPASLTKNIIASVEEAVNESDSAQNEQKNDNLKDSASENEQDKKYDEEKGCNVYYNNVCQDVGIDSGSIKLISNNEIELNNCGKPLQLKIKIQIKHLI